MKYAVKTYPRPTTSAGNVTTYVSHVTVVKVPWWKRVLRRQG
jgi:hypothetical protein